MLPETSWALGIASRWFPLLPLTFYVAVLGNRQCSLSLVLFHLGPSRGEEIQSEKQMREFKSIQNLTYSKKGRTFDS